MLPPEAIREPDYTVYLEANMDSVWENLKIDDGLEAVVHEVWETLPLGGEITLYLTDNCSAFDASYRDTFGILIEFRVRTGNH